VTKFVTRTINFANHLRFSLEYLVFWLLIFITITITIATVITINITITINNTNCSIYLDKPIILVLLNNFRLINISEAIIANS